VRRDHRPYYIKKAYLKFQRFYGRRFLAPQFDALGRGHVFVRPWHIEVFGPSIRIGNYVHVIAAADRKVRLAVWPEKDACGGIDIGDHCLISPGVRVGAADSIRIGDNCMLASGVYLTDSDWHDIYNRIATGRSAPIEIGDNVWIGDGAVVCKGVRIGANSIIGAGAVVIHSVPPNCIAAGNPARVVKELDPGQPLTTRAHLFRDPEALLAGLEDFDRGLLRANSLRHWLRYLLFPSRED